MNKVLDEYDVCPRTDIPEGVRFDVPGHRQGQIVEVAFGGFGRGEHGEGDPFMRITDRSERSVTYYRRRAE